MTSWDNSEDFYIDVNHGLDFIGDIHACYDELIELVDKLGYKLNEKGLYEHENGRRIVSLGDVMSRGPKSIECILFFYNHVQAELGFMTDSNHGWKIARWLDRRKVELKHGDERVAEEFIKLVKEKGIEAVEALKERFRVFLIKAPSHYVFNYKGKRIVAVHGGIKDHYIGKENKRIKDFCRYGDVSGTDEFGKPIRKAWYLEHHSNELVIWGHDAKKEPLVINNTINIDQGVVFGGMLTAYRYPEDEFIFVQAKENYSGVEDKLK